MVFKGPAFPDRQAAGMSMGGGLWPVRYVNYCGSLFEDTEEDEVRTFRMCDMWALVGFCAERVYISWITWGACKVLKVLLRKRRAICARVLVVYCFCSGPRKLVSWERLFTFARCLLDTFITVSSYRQYTLFSGVRVLSIGQLILGALFKESLQGRTFRNSQASWYKTGWFQIV